MRLGRHKRTLIYYLVITIVFTVVMIVAIPEGGGGSRILTSPFQTPAQDGLFILYMISVTSIVFGLLMGYILGPFYLYIQKMIMGRKMVYAIIEKLNEKPFKRALFQGFFPALLTLNISFILTNNESIRFLVTGSPSAEISYLYTALLGLFYIASGVAMGLFSPTWFLNDSGIVFIKKEDFGSNPEILNVGRWYSNLIKGYAGISVLLTFYLFIFEVASSPGALEQPGAIISLFAVPLFPFIIAFYIVPAIIVKDITLEHRRKYILKVANKMGIKRYINISVTETQESS